MAETNVISPEAWMEAASKGSGITVEELDTRMKAYAAKRREYEAQKAVATKLHGEMEELEGALVEAMEQAGKKRYDVDGIGMVYFSDKLVVPTPKTVADKKACFMWVRATYGENFYLDKLSINHQTLQKLYNDAFEEHKEKCKVEGKEDDSANFHIPGLAAPTNMRSLNFKGEKNG